MSSDKRMPGPIPLLPLIILFCSSWMSGRRPRPGLMESTGIQPDLQTFLVDTDRLQNLQRSLIESNAKKAEAMRLLRKRRKEEKLTAASKGKRSLSIALQKQLPAKRSSPKRTKISDHHPSSLPIKWPAAVPLKPEVPEPEPPQELIEVALQGQENDREYSDSEQPNERTANEEQIKPPGDDTQFVGLVQEIYDTLWEVKADNKVKVATRCLLFLKSITRSAEPSDG